MADNTLPERDSESRSIIEEFQRTGDDKTFARLYELYRERIFYFIYARVGSDDAARDVFQEIMLKVYNTLPKFDFRCKFETYLFRIVNNHLIDRYRKNKRSVSMVMMSEQEEASIADTVGDERVRLEDSVIDKERHDALHTELHLLPVQLRSVMLMRFYDGLQYDEISEINGESIRNVKYKVKKASMMLREKLQARGYALNEIE